MLAYLFPGQGSQTPGMGKDLFGQFPELVKMADDILGYSITDLCVSNDPRLNQTQFTQPALFTVNALSYLEKIRQPAAAPDYVLGHSLGEFNALFAAEVFDFATGLQLVQKRGALMSAETNGAMSAILGLTESEIQNRLSPTASVVVANHNSYLQSVISGNQQDITAISTDLKKLAGATVIPLKVSGAFHSPLMADAANAFADYLKQFTFKTPKLPVLANVNAEWYHPANTSQNLVEQISHSVRWVSSVDKLLKHENMIFEELGCGKILTGLVNRIQKKQ